MVEAAKKKTTPMPKKAEPAKKPEPAKSKPGTSAAQKSKK
jgi:hypothetical protein